MAFEFSHSLPINATMRTVFQYIFPGWQLLLLFSVSSAMATPALLETKSSTTAPSEIILSSAQNVIILSFDSLQGSFFAAMLAQQHPLLKSLDGFTFYPDTVSTAPLTKVSIPDILMDGLHQYDGEMTTRGPLLENNFLLASQRFGLNVSVFGVPCRYSLLKTCDNGESLLPVTIPALAAKDEGETIELHQFSSHLSAFEQYMDTVTLNHGRPSLLYHHYLFTHQPFFLDADCRYFKASKGINKYAAAYDEMVCSFRKILKFIDILKRLDVYERSTLIITADHGHEQDVNSDSSLFFDRQFDGAVRSKHSFWSASKYNPLLLFKPAGAKGALKVSARRSSLLDIPATACSILNSCSASAGVSLLQSVAVSRTRQLRVYRHCLGESFHHWDDMAYFERRELQGDLSSLPALLRQESQYQKQFCQEPSKAQREAFFKVLSDALPKAGTKPVTGSK